MHTHVGRCAGHAKKDARAYAFQLQFVRRLLEEVHRACYVKLSGATV